MLYNLLILYFVVRALNRAFLVVRDVWETRRYEQSYKAGCAYRRQERLRVEAAIEALKQSRHKDHRLIALDLKSPPSCAVDLRKARNAALLRKHPDRNGDHSQAIEINAAYASLLEDLHAKSA